MHIIALLLTVALTVAAARADTDAVTVRPDDTGVALVNPGMGWVFHHYDNSIHGYGPPLGPAYDGREFPGLSVAYLRLAWSCLEPEEGVFNWSVVDTPAERYIAAGKRIAFRITCYEGSDETPYATPQWVRAAGARGHDLGAYREPDYDDPIYLAKLESFLKAFGARYDGNPNVAFVDVGTLGIWGEGHPIARQYSFATARRHMDLHRKHLPHTLLAVGDDFANWFGDDDLTQIGRTSVPVAFEVPPEARGQRYSVFAGLWVPGDASRPNARLLPSNGADDRRVPVGRITFDDQGQGEFTAALPPAGPGGDFEIAQVAYRQTGDRGLLDIAWDVRSGVAANVQPFCHLDRDGAIAIGGGRTRGKPVSIDYAREVGMTLRDDSILVEAPPHAYYSADIAQGFWPLTPAILESGHYGYCKQTGTWGDGSEYLHAVENYHASYASIHANPLEFLAENRDLIRRINLRIGYRIRLVEATWPNSIARGERLPIQSQWANAGVAPCHAGGFPAWWLFDAQGRVLAVVVDDGLNVRDLPVGPASEMKQVQRERSFLLPPDLPAGEYELRVSVGGATGTPGLALPLSGDDGQMRYALGKLTIR